MEILKAITFDAGNTLLQPWPSVGAVYAEEAARQGVVAEAAVLESNFAEAWKAAHSFDYTKQAWANLVDDVFTGIAEQPPSETFFDALYERFAEPFTWRVYDDVLPTLEALQRRGIRLAVLSNWDLRLRKLISQLNLQDYFEKIFVSAELGCQKPDARIFEIVVTELNLPPHQILHVGDSECEDFQGARAAGMQSRHLKRDREGLRDGEIESLSELIR